MNIRMRWHFFLVPVLAIAGCSRGEPPRDPAPRPVAVLELEHSDPGRFEQVTGVVASWKTDQLDFEVSGRVRFIIEPELNIVGQMYDADGKLLTEATLLASLDPTRYDLAVASAEAQVLVAQKQREAADIELQREIPAQVAAAEAQRKLDETELNRRTRLLQQNAASQSDVDLAQTRLAQSVAKLESLAASKEAKAAEIASIDARISELQEAQRTAERDREDCELFSSYPGQVADVHVVPGSFVQNGQPVATVQMMDPIKVEVEVSAATARRLNHRDQINIFIPQPSGEPRRRIGFLYQVDPVADPTTRTFTVTVMLRNELIRAAPPAELEGQPVVRAGLVSKIHSGVSGLVEGLFINEELLGEDEQGHYLLKVLNRRVDAASSGGEGLLRVEKVHIRLGELRLPFFGIATMREVKLDDDTPLNPDVDMFAGRLTLPDGVESWDGKALLFDMPRWLVKPGDLVGVDQSGAEVQPGIYVPLDAIVEQSGTTYVFRVSESPDGDVARRIDVKAFESVDTLRRIEAVGDQPLEPGTRIVASGAAFLADGERINVARVVQLAP